MKKIAILLICLISASNISANDIRGDVNGDGIVDMQDVMFIDNTLLSAIVGVFGASALWGIGELFQQKKRVEKGWYPKNPKRDNF